MALAGDDRTDEDEDTGVDSFSGFKVLLLSCTCFWSVRLLCFSAMFVWAVCLIANWEDMELTASCLAVFCEEEVGVVAD